ncbi:AAA family ATPase [Kineococcus sp. DHX-1]|uniref:AAA family ATPase n=1 Tax=Kineococcus sp. DHX-1 TaxID=3349638 RepID=UPI0036D2E418
MAAVVILLNGLPGAGKTTLSRGLVERTGWPCLGKDAVEDALAPCRRRSSPAPGWALS